MDGRRMLLRMKALVRTVRPTTEHKEIKIIYSFIDVGSLLRLAHYYCSIQSIGSFQFDIITN